MRPPELICPSCSSHFKQPASLCDGQRFQCPKCGVKFRIVAASRKSGVQKPALPEAEGVEEVEEVVEEVLDDLEIVDASESQPGKKKMKESQRMKLAYWGLGLYYAKFICVLVNLLLVGLFMIARLIASDFLNATLNTLHVPLSAGMSLLGLTGALLCFWVPKRSKARVLIQVSFGLDVGAILAQSLGTILLLMGSWSAIAGGLISAMGSFATLGACVLFILFLRAFASYLHDRGTESEAIEVMVRWLVMTVLAPLAFVPFGALAAVSGKSVAASIFSLILVGGLYSTYLVFYFRTLIRLLNLISALREKIVSRYDFD